MMCYSLVVNPEAQADLAEAIAYYNDQCDGLGREFANCVDEALATIRENPQLAAEIYRSARLALVRRFPFLVCYRIVEDEVRIISVFHGRRDSRTWKSGWRKPPWVGAKPHQPIPRRADIRLAHQRFSSAN